MWIHVKLLLSVAGRNHWLKTLPKVNTVFLLTNLTSQASGEWSQSQSLIKYLLSRDMTYAKQMEIYNQDRSN